MESGLSSTWIYTKLIKMYLQILRNCLWRSHVNVIKWFCFESVTDEKHWSYFSFGCLNNYVHYIPEPLDILYCKIKTVLPENKIGFGREKESASAPGFPSRALDFAMRWYDVNHTRNYSTSFPGLFPGNEVGNYFLGLTCISAPSVARRLKRTPQDNDSSV